MTTTNDWYMAVAYAVRDRMMNDWIQAFGRARGTRARIVSYLSAEFLIGPQVGSNLLNVHDVRDNVEAVLDDLGQNLDNASCPRAGARARQWRLGPSGRLLHGLAHQH